MSGIVAPVSRAIHVIDPERSVAFYRDLLGFTAEPVVDDAAVGAVAQLARGPARIQLIETSAAHHAILFFQCDDVARMRDELRTRGAQPTDVEKVNWIKMAMFEVRDPDGHTLWFGQSYQEDTPAPATWQIRQLLPELPVADVPAAIAHYRDVLGFHVNYAQDDLGVMDRDRVTLLLILRTDQHRGIGSCYAYIRDADALHAELRSRGANVLDAPVSHPWGLRDFHVLDLDGNRLTFGQTFE